MKTKILIPLLALMCLLATSATAQVNYSVSGSLTSVTIPNRVTRIGDHAFYSCTSLTNLTF